MCVCTNGDKIDYTAPFPLLFAYTHLCYYCVYYSLVNILCDISLSLFELSRGGKELGVGKCDKIFMSHHAKKLAVPVRNF